MSSLDVLASFAEVAATEMWCEPHFQGEWTPDSGLSEASTELSEASTGRSGDDGRAASFCGIVLEGARHPLLDCRPTPPGKHGSVVPNDVSLGVGGLGRIALITGPNCGGKVS
jgi:DNA mismatch repair ATPase MutS